MDRFVAHQRAVARAAQDRRRAATLALEPKLAELAEALVALGARRVVLFGSVARGETTDASDVDVAVLGLPPSRHLEAARLGLSITGRAVDVVRLEEARPTLRARIEAEGRVLRDVG